MMKRIWTLALALAAASLGACGSSDPPIDEATRAALMSPVLGQAACMPQADYEQRKAAGVFRPLPQPLPDGAFWVNPWLLVPASSGGSTTYAPGLVGTPVVVTGPDGLPKNVLGIFYVDGETPEWICTP